MQSNDTSSDASPSTGGEETRPTFDSLPLSAELKETLAEIGYVHPTPVQLAVWEPATRGKDAVVQARTGTGKTASFGLPIVDQIVRRSLQKTQVLCLCPTRELALQVKGEIERLGKKKNVRVSAVYGGAGMQRQIDELAEGAHVVVGTPGRVLDHLKRRTFDPSAVRLLVLDESDEMLSMGFERELSAILDFLPKERQTLLFSATLPPEIERMAKNRLRSPEFVTLSSDAVGALGVLHYAYFISGDKLGSFLRILEVENPESAIVFCNTKDETENVAGALQRAGYDADWLNGDLAQHEREKVMAATREGRVRFLVATDVAARGIDVSHLTHVINYDIPESAESYVHRTGRTGRAGRTGTAIALALPGDMGALYYLRLTYKIRPIEKQLPTPGELKTRAEADLVQWLLDAYASRGTAEARALAKRILAHDEAERIVAGIVGDILGARPEAAEAAAARRRAPAPPAPKPPEDAPAPVGASSHEAPRPAAREPRPPRDREPSRDRRDRRERGDRPRRDGPRFDAPRPDGARGEAPLGEGLRAAPPPARGSGPSNALIEWQPPEEDNDDEPILPKEARSEPAPEPPPAGELDGLEDGAEIFVNLGRRDGVRAADIVRVLQEGGFADADVRRVRVRDKHAFVTVPKEELQRAIAALTGVEVAGKRLAAEPSRRTLEAADA